MLIIDWEHQKELFQIMAEAINIDDICFAEGYYKKKRYDICYNRLENKYKKYEKNKKS